MDSKICRINFKVATAPRYKEKNQTSKINKDTVASGDSLWANSVYVVHTLYTKGYLKKLLKPKSCAKWQQWARLLACQTHSMDNLILATR